MAEWSRRGWWHQALDVQLQEAHQRLPGQLGGHLQERVQAGTPATQGVFWQPQLSVDEVVGKDTLLNLVSVLRGTSNEVPEVVVAQYDSKLLDSIPDDVVVLMAVIALGTCPP